jgi:hypothetical protein
MKESPHFAGLPQHIPAQCNSAVNQLKALIVSAPEELRGELRGRGTKAQISYCAALRRRPTRSLEHQMTARALQVTARRLQQLRAEIDTLQHDIHGLVTAVAPWLLELPGGGPDHRRPGPGQLVARWTVALRGRLCSPGRDQPDPGLLGTSDPLPAQPPWRPAAQQRSAHHRRGPPPRRPADSCLCPAANAQGKNPREIKRCL